MEVHTKPERIMALRTYGFEKGEQILFCPDCVWQTTEPAAGPTECPECRAALNLIRVDDELLKIEQEAKEAVDLDIRVSETVRSERPIPREFWDRAFRLVMVGDIECPKYPSGVPTGTGLYKIAAHLENEQEKQEAWMLVAAIDPQGEYEFFFCKVSCRETDRESGRHRDAAMGFARSEGWEPYLAYSDQDRVVNLLHLPEMFEWDTATTIDVDDPRYQDTAKDDLVNQIMHMQIPLLCEVLREEYSDRGLLVYSRDNLGASVSWDSTALRELGKEELSEILIHLQVKERQHNQS